METQHSVDDLLKQIDVLEKKCTRLERDLCDQIRDYIDLKEKYYNVARENDLMRKQLSIEKTDI